MSTEGAAQSECRSSDLQFVILQFPGLRRCEKIRSVARAIMRLSQNSPGSCADGLSSPSGSRGALLNFLRLRHTDYVTWARPMARRHRLFGRMSEPHYQGNLSFATVSHDPRHRPNFFTRSDAGGCKTASRRSETPAQSE